MGHSRDRARVPHASRKDQHHFSCIYSRRRCCCCCCCRRRSSSSSLTDLAPPRPTTRTLLPTAASFTLGAPHAVAARVAGKGQGRRSPLLLLLGWRWVELLLLLVERQARAGEQGIHVALCQPHPGAKQMVVVVQPKAAVEVIEQKVRLVVVQHGQRGRGHGRGRHGLVHCFSTWVGLFLPSYLLLRFAAAACRCLLEDPSTCRRGLRQTLFLSS